MLRRWHILLLILVTLAAFYGLAAAKLRATPKYDRLQIGMTADEVQEFLGSTSVAGNDCLTMEAIRIDEGEITARYNWEMEEGRIGPSRLTEKSITPRSPLERLAWLAGWR